MEGASGLVAGGEVLQRGDMEMRGKTSELLDTGDARRRPLSAPWRRMREWAGAP